MSGSVKAVDDRAGGGDVGNVQSDGAASFRRVKDACSVITKKQLALSELGLQFDEQERVVKERIRGLVSDLTLFAGRSGERLLAQAECMASRRRAEIRDIRCQLTLLHPVLLHLCSDAGDGAGLGDDGEGQLAERRRRLTARVDEVLAKSDEIFSAEDWEREYLTVLNLTLGPQVSALLNRGTRFDSLMRISNIMSAELLALRVTEINSGAGEVVLEVEAMVSSAKSHFGHVRNFLPHVILSELRAEVGAGSHEANRILEPTSFKTLKRQGNLLSASATVVKLTVPVDFAVWGGRDALVKVTLSDVPIKNSPCLVSMRGDDIGEQTNRWTTVPEGSAKASRRTDDLDESDLKSMGYRSMMAVARDGLSPVLEENEDLLSPAAGAEKAFQVPSSAKASAVEVASVHLPLDQPSPIAAIHKGRSASEIACASPRGAFTPSVSSTGNNFAAKIHGLEIPEMQPVEEGDEGVSRVLEEARDALNVSKLQENLSAKAQASDNRLRNVSFNPETSIMELNHPEETLPFRQGSMDAAAAAQKPGWMIRKGSTKLEDGELSLSKSLLQAAQCQSLEDSFGALLCQSNASSAVTEPEWSSIASRAAGSDSCWDYSPEEWLNFLKEKESAANGRVLRACDESMWDGGDEKPFWQKSRPSPKFDLSLPDFHFHLVKALSLGAKSAGVPQTVSRDGSLDLTYVTDIENNVIHLFQGWDYKGVWRAERTFVAPRYVLCIPDHKHGDRHGMNVVVLDQVAMYVFKRSGRHKATVLEGEGSKFRGLAFHHDYGHVVTLKMPKQDEDSQAGVHIVFVETERLKQVVKRVLLEPVAGDDGLDFDPYKTMCRYLSCSGGKVVTTDMGLGCFYVTDLRTGVTRRHCQSKKLAVDQADVNLLKEATGVTTDPAGNILVATCNQEIRQHGLGPLLLFDPEGKFIKSVEGVNVERPTGICLDERNLYVVDVRKRSVSIHSLAQVP